MTTEPTEFTFTSPSNCYAITRTDSCVRHPSVAWTVACGGCIRDALVQEYERGKAEGRLVTAPTTRPFVKPCEKFVLSAELPADVVTRMSNVCANPSRATSTVTELRTRLTRAHARVSDYYKELCDLRVCYATLKQHHEKAREQIEVAHRIVKALKTNTLFSPSLQQALKEWDAL